MGGLATATQLASRNQKVIVLEKLIFILYNFKFTCNYLTLDILYREAVLGSTKGTDTHLMLGLV